MSIYLKLERINGNVTDKDHKNWIQLLTVQFEMGRKVTRQNGVVNNRAGSLPSVSELVVTKEADVATPKLVAECFKGQCIGNATIAFTETLQTSRTYLHYQLDNVLLAHYDVDAAQDNEQHQVIETLKLNFTKLEVKYTPRTSDNRNGTPLSAGFDLKTATAI